MGVELTFDADKHEYRAGGVVVPSVTQILSACGLYDLGFVSAHALQVAAERGQIVHYCIELYEQGELDESTIDPELDGYFESYLRAKDAGLLPNKPSAIEQRVYSEKFKYAGTIDQIYGSGWINDLKTGIPQPEIELQLSAYWLTKNEQLNVKPERLTGTYLHEDGTIAEVVDYQYVPHIWLSFLTNYRWREKYGKLKG